MSDDDGSQGPPAGAIHQVVPRLQNGPPQTSTMELAAGLSRWMDASNNFIYVELASLVLLFACVADWYPTVWHKYALSVACVSLVTCLVLQTAEFLIPGFLQSDAVRQREDGTGGHSVQKVCSVLMLLWWIFGTGIITFHGEMFSFGFTWAANAVLNTISITMTFHLAILARTLTTYKQPAPFVVTSNGWFGAWGGLIATVKWSIGLKSSLYDEQPEGLKQLYNITICAVVLLLASIPPLIQKWEHYGGAGFSIAGAAITLIACAYSGTMYNDIPKNTMKITVVLLFVLWTCVAGVCTFHGPFLITNNGFFSCWLGCLCSLNLLVIEMKDASPENYT